MNANPFRWNDQVANMSYLHDRTCDKCDTPRQDNCNLCDAVVRTGLAYDCLNCGVNARFMCHACKTQHNNRHFIVEHDCFLETQIQNHQNVMANNVRQITMCLLLMAVHGANNWIWMEVFFTLSDLVRQIDVTFERKRQARDRTMVVIVHKSDKLFEAAKMLIEMFLITEEDLSWVVTAYLVNLENSFRSIDQNALEYVGDDNPTLRADWFENFHFEDFQLNDWLNEARRRPYLARQEIREIRRLAEMNRAEQDAPVHPWQLVQPPHPYQQAGLQLLAQMGHYFAVYMRQRHAERMRNQMAAQPAVQPAAPHPPLQQQAPLHQVHHADLQMAAQMGHQLAVQPAEQVLQQHVARMRRQNAAQRGNQVAPQPAVPQPAVLQPAVPQPAVPQPAVPQPAVLQPAVPRHQLLPALQHQVQQVGLPMAVQMGLRQAEQIRLQNGAQMVLQHGVQRRDQVAAQPAAPHHPQQIGLPMMMNQRGQIVDNALQQRMQHARVQPAAQPANDGNPMQQIVDHQRHPTPPIEQQQNEYPVRRNLQPDQILEKTAFLLQQIVIQQGAPIRVGLAKLLLHIGASWIRQIIDRGEPVRAQNVLVVRQLVQQIALPPNDPEFANRLNELIRMMNVLDEQIRQQPVQQMQWDEQEVDQEQILQQIEEEQLEAHPEQEQNEPNEPQVHININLNTFHFQNDQVLVENDVEEAPNRPEVENQPVAGQNQQIPSGQVVSRNDDAAVQARQLSADSNEGTSRSAANSTNGADTSDDEIPRSSHFPMENEEREVVTRNGRYRRRQAPSENARIARRIRRRGRPVNSEAASSSQGASSSKRPRGENRN